MCWRAMTHTVYWLKSKSRNYVGYTTDLERRLLQHNGHRPGGAQRTRNGVWTIHEVIRGFNTKQDALRYEFALKLRKTDRAKHDFISQKETLHDHRIMSSIP